MNAALSVLRRIALTVPVLWLIITLVFLLIHIVPGDPIAQMMGEGASATDLSVLRHTYGLDLPLHTQYVHYSMGIFHGDLGNSLRLRESVTHLVEQRYPYTLLLSVAALLLALLLGVPAGIASALHRGRWTDRLLGGVSLLGLSVPNFALGPVLILVFSISLGWLPVSGFGSLVGLAGGHGEIL